MSSMATAHPIPSPPPPHPPSFSFKAQPCPASRQNDSKGSVHLFQWRWDSAGAQVEETF